MMSPRLSHLGPNIFNTKPGFQTGGVGIKKLSSCITGVSFGNQPILEISVNDILASAASLFSFHILSLVSPPTLLMSKTKSLEYPCFCSSAYIV